MDQTNGIIIFASSATIIYKVLELTLKSRKNQIKKLKKINQTKPLSTKPNQTKFTKPKLNPNKPF